MKAGCITAVLVLLAGVAQAQQPVFNPSVVEFAPSPDHAVTLSDGSAVVAGYKVKYLIVGAASPILVNDICKPPIDAATGKIVAGSTCPSGPLFGSPIAANTTYVVRVSVYGAGGESADSAISNPFAFVNPPSPVPEPPVVR
jgi:hypothetical protein